MTQQSNLSKPMSVTLWIMQALLAVFLLMGTILKFMPIDKLSAMMPWTGEVPVILVRLSGIIDLLGALGLVLPLALKIKPQLTAWAALAVAVLMLCAIVFHVSRGEASVIGVNIVALFMAGFIAWKRFR